MNKNEVYQNTLEWFKGDELAAQVWLSKYALKNKEGKFVDPSPKERYKAIAHDIGLEEATYTHDNTEKLINTVAEMHRTILNGEITPGGSGLFGIANPHSISSLGNCFVVSLNNEDSYGAIMKVDQELVQIMKRRGGVGLNISPLRPSKSPVHNAAKASSGAVSFMHRFSHTTREVAQENRRGALMLTMHINHPDIFEFIKAKRDVTKITGANISIMITDEFMNAIKDDETHYFRYPVNEPVKYIRNLEENTESFPEGVYGSMKARDLWDEIVKSNWIGAEPGLLFWDKILKESPADSYDEFKTESTNPC